MSFKFKTKTAAEINSCLNSYRDLLARVDRRLDDVRSRYPSEIACRKGCDCGCRNLSIFPIEALSVAMAIRDLPAGAADDIRQRACGHSQWDCPLHEKGACRLYPFRPIICRTHGFPLQTLFNGRPSIGFCRHNFKNRRSAVPHDAIIDLDGINSSLRAVNAALTGLHAFQVPDRLSISAAVLLEFDDILNT